VAIKLVLFLEAKMFKRCLKINLGKNTLKGTIDTFVRSVILLWRKQSSMFNYNKCHPSLYSR